MTAIGIGISPVMARRGGTSFDPGSIPNLQYRWDPSDGSKVLNNSGQPASNGEQVSEVLPTFGGISLRQITQTRRPTFSTGTSPGGQSTLTFAGAHGLVSVSNLNMSVGGGWTSFCIQKNTLPTPQDFAVVYEYGPTSAAGRHYFLIRTAALNDGSCRMDGLTSGLALTSAPANSDWFRDETFTIMRYRDNLTNARNIFRNGVAGQLNSLELVGGVDPSEPFNVGARDNGTQLFYRGEVGEILLYDRELSDSECTSIESYLAAKWL